MSWASHFGGGCTRGCLSDFAEASRNGIGVSDISPVRPVSWALDTRICAQNTHVLPGVHPCRATPSERIRGRSTP